MPIPSRWTRHKNKVGCPQTFDSSMSVRQQHIVKYPCLLLPISCICIQHREEVLCTIRLGGWQVGSLIQLYDRGERILASPSIEKSHPLKPAIDPSHSMLYIFPLSVSFPPRY